MVMDDTKYSDEMGEARESNGGGVAGWMWECMWGPLKWMKMLSTEMHWSFLFGVLVEYGVNQGVGGSLVRVATEYYMKDVQKVDPSLAQIYQGFTSIPWMIKPLWGLMTDVIPLLGYHRRPYFIFSGLVGIVSMLFLCLHERLPIFFAVVCLTAGSAGVAIADVTVDACVAENSNKHKHLAADMQTLCTMSSSIGSLMGFFFSGLLVHLIGPKGVYGLLTIPFVLVFVVGIILDENKTGNLTCREISQKFVDASIAMWNTIKLPDVWRPCLYMYLSLALSLNIYEGMFYWYTDPNAGPHFSQEFVGFILSIGSAGAVLATIYYQYALKDYQFRSICFWTQLFLGISGMLDFILVMRLNLKIGVPDHVFAVVDECASQLSRILKWMPLLVLSTKLCPPGIEGTFFALIMSIDNIGLFTSSWLGGILLHVLRITRTKFSNLWMAVLMRNVARICPLLFIFLIPATDPSSSSILPNSEQSIEEEEDDDDKDVELVSLVATVDSSR